MREIKNASEREAVIQKSGFMKFFSFPADSYAKLVMFAPREYIIQEGFMPSQLFFLTSGRAKLYTTLANGKVALIDFFEAPCFIGEMELFDHTEVYSIQAVAPCQCLTLPTRQCGPMLLEDVVFLREICRYLGRKDAKNVRVFAKNQSYPLQNRLASFILLSSVAGVYEEKHGNAADYLGVSYRHLLYVIAQFVSEGYLQKEGRLYRIADGKALLRLARAIDPEMKL